MQLYYDQFDQKYDYPPVIRPDRILIIASTPRCGSHMLGHALYKTGCFGFPLEYANLSNLAEWKKRFDKVHIKDVMGELQKVRTSPNGIFGIKVHYHHIRQFGGMTGLKDIFPNAYYVFLTRKNLLAQAVSFSKAKQTGVWIHRQKKLTENPEYNFNDIKLCLRQIILDNASWRYVLSSAGCNYMEMDFDTICSNLNSAILLIANFLDVDIDTSVFPITHVTQKQSNSLNAEWEKRFLADFSGGELIETGKSFFKSGIGSYLCRFKDFVREIIQHIGK